MEEAFISLSLPSLGAGILLGALGCWAWLRVKKPATKQAKQAFEAVLDAKTPDHLNLETEVLKRDVRDLSTILNALDIPIWKRDAHQHVGYCNIAFSEIAEEVSEHAHGVEELELFQGHRQLAQKALESGETQHTRRHIVVEGSRRLYDIHEIPFASDGITIGYALDISELEVAQEEIQRHISALRDLLESSTAAMSVYGKDGQLKYFNFAFVNLWKLDELWLETEPSYGAVLEQLREKRKLPEQANFLAYKQAQMRLFNSLIEPDESFLYLPDGKILRAIAIPHALGGVLFVHEDVTDRVALERSYNTLIAVQRETLDHLHEGVAVFSEDGRLRLCNPVFNKLWQVSDDFTASEPHLREWLAKSRDLFLVDDWDDFAENLVARLQQRQYMALRFDRADGSVVDCACVPLPDGGNLITFIDVTDSTLLERSLRERNEALEVADRVKTEFLANMSYELRSPLTSISGFAEMLSKSYIGPLNVTQSEYVQHIFESSSHLSQLISTIIDLATIEAGYMQLEYSHFSLPDAMQQVHELTASGLKTQGVKLVHHAAAKLGDMYGDQMRVKQIMLNLITTLSKYAKAQSEIRLTAEALDEQGIQLRVACISRGGSRQSLAGIFSSEAQTGESGAQQNAAELGLTLVRRFVGLHGGQVRAKLGDDDAIIITASFPGRSDQDAEKPARLAVSAESD
jgi:signal transduction histidine kinase